MKKRILLIGGKNKAKMLASTLIEKGYKVTAINKNYEDCLKLAETKNLNVIYGDATKAFILEQADAKNCDISIALTPKDADNLVASELCKKKFDIKKTVSLVSDPKKIIFFQKMGIDCAVCAVSSIANLITHQAFMDEIANVTPLKEGKIQIIEINIPEQAKINGKKLWEITLPKEVIIGYLLREDKSLIPRGDTRILTGDCLVLIAENGKEDDAIKILTDR